MRRCGISLYCMQPGVVSYINRITAGMWKDHDVKRFDPSDIGRKFLDSGASVGVVDERSEIGGCYMGVAQNHLGIRTDILDGCPKAEGMIMLIRSMGPQVIAVDEIGTPEDVHAIEYAMHCGCKMLATVHAESMEELRKKPLFNRMIGEGRFERYILLGNNAHVGQIEGIFDNRGSLLYKEAMEMAK